MAEHDHHDHKHGASGHQHTPANFGKAFAIGIALNLAYVVGEIFFTGLLLIRSPCWRMQVTIWGTFWDWQLHGRPQSLANESRAGAIPTGYAALRSLPRLPTPLCCWSSPAALRRKASAA